MTTQSAAIEGGSQTRPMEPELEAYLVRRACDGDADAFGQLYDWLVARVYRYVYFRVTDDRIAEDLTSQVFLKAWEHLPRYRFGKSPFLAWLYTIAHNMVIDDYRTRKQTMHLDELERLPAREPLPDEQSEYQVEARLLRWALRKLTDLQREVVTMRLVDGMSTDEIAQRLGKSPGAVRALQMRALQALAAVFEKQGATEF